MSLILFASAPWLTSGHGWSPGTRPPQLHCVGHCFGGAVAAILSGLLSQHIFAERKPPNIRRHTTDAFEMQAEADGELAHDELPKATCLALGPCPCTGLEVPLPGESIFRVCAALDFTCLELSRIQWGAYPDHVVPGPGVTSIVLGDDFFSRLHRGSLSNLRLRLRRRVLRSASKVVIASQYSVLIAHVCSPRAAR